VSSVRGAHNWLGFIHASYGFGCLVSPFVATAIASSSSEGSGRWMLFYLFPLGLSVLNSVLVVLAFRGDIHSIRRSANSEEEIGRSRGAVKEIKQMLKIKNIWLISMFFFFHLGVCMTAGGNSLPLPLPLSSPLTSQQRLGCSISRPSPARLHLHHGLHSIRLLRRRKPRPPPTC
jgi:hypothetical protein